MYKKNYEKYKRQYLKLKKNINDSGGYIDPDEEIDPEHMTMDHLTWDQSKPTYAYSFPTEMQDSVSITDSEYDASISMFNRIYTVQDVGIYGKARGINVIPYKFTDSQFVKLSDGETSNKPIVTTPSKLARQTDESSDTTPFLKDSQKKILLIDNLDDFDNFTDLYGSLNVFLDENVAERGKQSDLFINWDQVEDIYKGVYLKDGLKEDRYEEVYYKGGVYPSWWKSEFTFPDVLMFVKPEYEKYSGEPIKKPFIGSTFKENDLTSDDYTDIWSGSDPTRVVILDKFQAFDEFTNKYGSLRLKKSDKSKKSHLNNTNVIIIDWNKTNSDYRGFYIDKDNTFKKDRYTTAFLSGEEYPSWWKGEGIKEGVVYIFR